MSWRPTALHVIDSSAFRGVLAAVLVLLVCLPMFLLGKVGIGLVLGAIFGFWGGYSFARVEWRKRGYVPKYDAMAKPPEQLNR